MMYEPIGITAGVKPPPPLADIVSCAAAYARQQNHCLITPEHLLLALFDDPGAAAIMRAAIADMAGVRAAAGDAVVRHLARLRVNGRCEPQPSHETEQLLLAVSAGSSNETAGARLLAALAAEHECIAAAVLRQYGLGARQAMQRATAQANAAGGKRNGQRPSLAAPVASGVHTEHAVNGRASAAAGSRHRPRGGGELLDRLRQIRVDPSAPVPPDTDEAGAPPPARTPPAQHGLPAPPAVLLEKFPRRLHPGQEHTAEIVISREDVPALFGETGENLAVSRAVSIILAAPDGVAVETLAPQTQWVFDRPSFLETEPFGGWRWRLTAKQPGKHRLRLLVSCRCIDAQGMAQDTGQTAHILDVRVARNFARGLRRLAGWLLLLAASGASGAAVATLWPAVMPVLRQWTGI